MCVALIGHEVGGKLRGSQEERGKEKEKHGRETASIIIIITDKGRKVRWTPKGILFYCIHFLVVIFPFCA